MSYQKYNGSGKFSKQQMHFIDKQEKVNKKSDDSYASRFYSSADRLMKIATEELNAEIGGLGNRITRESLRMRYNVVLVISTVLAPYYKIKENQNEIDLLIEGLDSIYTKDLGPVSITDEVNKVLDQLEGLLKKYKSE